MSEVALSPLLPTVTATVCLAAKRVVPVTVAVTVTVRAPPFSVTLSGLAVSVTAVAAASSSVMVIWSLPTVRPETAVEPETDSVSPAPSSIASWVGSSEKVLVPLSLPASTVSVKSSTVP